MALRWADILFESCAHTPARVSSSSSLLARREDSRRCKLTRVGTRVVDHRYARVFTQVPSSLQSYSWSTLYVATIGNFFASHVLIVGG